MAGNVQAVLRFLNVVSIIRPETLSETFARFGDRLHLRFEGTFSNFKVSGTSTEEMGKCYSKPSTDEVCYKSTMCLNIPHKKC